MNVALLCSHEVFALVVWLEREGSSTVCKEVLMDILFVCFLITDPIDPPVCGHFLVLKTFIKLRTRTQDSSAN